MGYIELRGDLSFYIEEDGTVWDSPKKERQFNPDTREPLSIFLLSDKPIITDEDRLALAKRRGILEDAYIPNDGDTVVVKRKAGRPKKVVI